MVCGEYTGQVKELISNVINMTETFKIINNVSIIIASIHTNIIANIDNKFNVGKLFKNTNPTLNPKTV